MGPDAAAAIDEATVARYRRNYGLGPEIGPTHIAKHVEVEGRLTRELLESTPETRWTVFERAYSSLYQELPWLNVVEHAPDPETFAPWRSILKRPVNIFEVGSGKAHLLRNLAAQGHRCVATEITQERGERHAADLGIEWHTTDGIHLDRFEPADHYDVVISSQVIEHLHPEDVVTHFKAARRILHSGGEYLLDTPHKGTGPHDLSRPMGFDDAKFMHLKEYDYPELVSLVRQAGFRRVRAVWSFRGLTLRSGVALALLSLMDRLIGALGLSRSSERRLRNFRLLRLLGPSEKIWLCATA